MKSGVIVALAVVLVCIVGAGLASGSPKIAFVRGDGIWTANADGTGQKRIIPNADSPRWSPDKKRIAFARDNNVWVANADGSGQRRLTSGWSDRDGSAIDISWRPQSNTITYSHEETIKLARARQGQDQMFCVSLFDVSSVSKAIPKGYVRYDMCDSASAFYFPANGSPAWSRSGNKLGFARNGDIWMAEWDEPSDGRPGWEVGRLAAVASYDGATNRASHSTVATERLSWSPDERMLAYALTRIGGSGIAELHVLVLDKSGAVKKDRLLDRNGKSPCFSPDGKLIAYTQDLDGFNIYVILPDGNGKRLIIKDGSQPDW